MNKYSGRWTDSDNIKAHLQSSEVELPSIKNSELPCIDLDANQLPYNNITENSEVAKIQKTYTHTQTTAVLTGTTPVLLSQYLIKDTVIVASDIALSIIYVEDTDYIIDYSAGTIERASVGSTISSGSTVFVWYIPYTILIKNTDYEIQYDAGTIARIAGTSIPNGASIFVDFSHALSTITDDLIKRAIIESEEFMADRISNTAVSDEGLTTSANYYILSIICLSQATKELKSRSDNSDDLAKQWMLLHDSYINRAIMHFKKYTKSTDLNPGGAIQNRYSRDRALIKTNPSIAPGYRRF